MRSEKKLVEDWEFRAEDARGNALGAWTAVEVPSAWQRYPGAWNHRGRARYRIRIPPAADPAARRWLRFDGVQYRCRIHFRGKRVGAHEGGWDPFWMPLPSGEGGDGLLELLVEGVGPELPVEETTAGFLPDCGIMPSGIWKDVHLVEGAALVIEGAVLKWIPSKKTLRVRPVVTTARGGAVTRLAAELRTAEGEGVAGVEVINGDRRPLDLEVPDPRLWRLEDPYRYMLRVTAEDREGRSDLWEIRTGLRHLSAGMDRVLLNGEPLMIRGVLHWGYDPSTIAPNGDEKVIAEELAAVKAYGFNLVKHCLYVPQDIYFRLADEAGLLQWLELPLWLPSGSRACKERVRKEFPRIARSVQHHPSLVVYSLGCELNDRVDAGFLTGLFRSVNRLIPNALLCDNSGSGDCYGGPETGISDFYDYHFYAEPCNLGGLMDAFSAPWRQAKPWFFGEFCDSDGYRDLDAVRTGLDGKTRWWLSRDPAENPLLDGSRVQRELGCLFQDERLKSLGLGGAASRLMRASRRHSMTHRKRTLEIARQYPCTAGYVITGIRDTAITTSGMFDDLGRERYDVQDFRSINEDTLLLLLPPPRRAWVHGGDRRSGFDLHHQVGGTAFNALVCTSFFGSAPARGTELLWRLITEEGADRAQGVMPVVGIVKHGLQPLGNLSFELPRVDRWTRFTLELSWPLEKGAAKNAWPIWIHPKPFLEGIRRLHLHDPSGDLVLLEGLEGGEDAPVWVCSSLDGSVRRRLEAGGNVILIQHSGLPLESVAQPFWREAILLSEPHPLSKRFPFQDGGGEELLALTTDRFFTGWLEGSGFSRWSPILVRLDARAFTSSCALAELEGYPGRCLATTLRVQGGIGDLPYGLRNNRAGRALLAAMAEELASGGLEA